MALSFFRAYFSIDNVLNALWLPLLATMSCARRMHTGAGKGQKVRMLSWWPA